MPYNFSWYDDEHSIIHVDIRGEVSWEAWHIAVGSICEMIPSVNHRVDLILDDKVGMPPGNPMPHMQASIKKLQMNKNMGLVVSVTSKRMSTFSKVIVDVASRLANSDLEDGIFVETLDEALTVINMHRKEQPNFVDKRSGINT
ncbi:MAG: hypothetical protein H6670_17085 [Anaerolineaceae bacterium]|nr:hypothetical protein [Anaerolineaceae bacterium]